MACADLHGNPDNSVLWHGPRVYADVCPAKSAVAVGARCMMLLTGATCSVHTVAAAFVHMFAVCT